jgi:hypothetical protein
VCQVDDLFVTREVKDLVERCGCVHMRSSQLRRVLVAIFLLVLLQWAPRGATC